MAKVIGHSVYANFQAIQFFRPYRDKMVGEIRGHWGGAKLEE